MASEYLISTIAGKGNLYLSDIVEAVKFFAGGEIKA
jgi:hypothetical protein